MRNRYAGACFRCGTHVERQQGHPHRRNGAWSGVCLECVEKHRDAKEKTLAAAYPEPAP